MAFLTTTPGNDVITPFGTNTGEFTTDAADMVIGNAGEDRIEAGGGDDIVVEGFGNDTVFGDDGNDSLAGGPGRDLLEGGAGNDQLGGDRGDDTLSGGDGDDALFGNNGTDLLTGGAGADRFGLAETGFRLPGLSIATDFTLGEDRIDVTGITVTNLDTLEFLRGATAGGDLSLSFTLGGATQTLVLRGVDAGIDLGALNPFLYDNPVGSRDAGTDAVDDLFGARGNDTLLGGGGNDRLFGQEGRDLLRGGAGDDLLFGGSGFDVLSGGAGQDTLISGADGEAMTGGAGDDLFLFRAETEGAVIRDFTSGEDVIDLSAVDADLTQAGDQDFTFIGSARFSGAGQLRLKDNLLQADLDGDGVVDLRITLQPGAAFDAADLIG